MSNGFHIQLHFRHCIARNVCQRFRKPPEDCQFDVNWAVQLVTTVLARSNHINNYTFSCIQHWNLLGFSVSFSVRRNRLLNNEYVYSYALKNHIKITTLINFTEILVVAHTINILTKLFTSNMFIEHLCAFDISLWWNQIANGFTLFWFSQG